MVTLDLTNRGISRCIVLLRL